MSSIDHFDLRAFDLNLLVAFDALMEARSVTRAATRLKVGQPTMSHSLQTLRVLLDDELFVRVGAAMRPTARADALAPRIRDALQRVQETLRSSASFDPRTEERTVRLGFSSELELIALPDLAAHLASRAPGIASSAAVPSGTRSTPCSTMAGSTSPSAATTPASRATAGSPCSSRRWRAATTPR